MENNKETLTDIDRAKELFEYEMTAVLLNLKGEFENVGKDIENEYLEMEVPEPKLEYASPELEAEGVRLECELPGSVELSGIEPVSVSLEGFEAAGAPVPGEVALTSIEAVDISAAREAIAGIAPSEVGKVSMPSVPASVTVNVAGALPSAGFVQAKTPSVPKLPEAEKVQGVSVDMPVGEVRAEAFEIPAVDRPEAVITGLEEIPVEAEQSFELPPVQVESITVGYGPAETGEFTAPELSAPEVERIEVGAVPPEEISFKFPEIHLQKAALPEYPEMPEKPDFSADIEEILAAVRAEG